MATHDDDGDAPWEPPVAIALTETESRADHADIWFQNAATGAS